MKPVNLNTGFKGKIQIFNLSKALCVIDSREEKFISRKNLSHLSYPLFKGFVLNRGNTSFPHNKIMKVFYRETDK